MTTSKDMIRKASLFTMHGLIDPRLIAGPDTEAAGDITPKEQTWVSRLLWRIMRRSADRRSVPKQ